MRGGTPCPGPPLQVPGSPPHTTTPLLWQSLLSPHLLPHKNCTIITDIMQVPKYQLIYFSQQPMAEML